MTPNEKPEALVWTPELVGRFWDGVARSRLAELSFARHQGKSLLVAIDHLLPREGRILDFGAGDGHLVRYMCERGLRAAAYEPSAERSRKIEENMSGVAGFLGVENGASGQAYDVVIASEVMEHVLDVAMEETLAQLGALTKVGGTLIVTTPNNEDLELGECLCPLTGKRFHRWQHVRSFTTATLTALMDRAGFDLVVVHSVQLVDSLFRPYDGKEDGLPELLQKIRANEPVSFGTDRIILYVGRRRG